MDEYERKVQYHETDKMGIVHHSNYIKWMEEARAEFLEKRGIPYYKMEALGIVSPVVEVDAKYKSPATFGDIITVSLGIREFNGVRLTVDYTMTKQDGTVVCEAFSSHCFMKDNKIISLTKSFPQIGAFLKNDI